MSIVQLPYVGSCREYNISNEVNEIFKRIVSLIHSFNITKFKIMFIKDFDGLDRNHHQLVKGDQSLTIIPVVLSSSRMRMRQPHARISCTVDKHDSLLSRYILSFWYSTVSRKLHNFSHLKLLLGNLLGFDPKKHFSPDFQHSKHIALLT